MNNRNNSKINQKPNKKVMMISRSSIQLRDYQEDSKIGIKNVWRKMGKRALLCLPTGGGKTYAFSSIVKDTIDKSPLSQVLILTHRHELLTQAGGALDSIGITAQYIASRSKCVPGSNVYVGMVGTVMSRRKRGKLDWLKPKLIIIDEAHRGEFGKVFSEWPDAYYIGATATPIYASRKRAIKHDFNGIVSEISSKKLIERGILARPEPYALPFDKGSMLEVDKRKGDYTTESLSFAFDTEESVQTVYENYIEHCNNEKCVVFCVTISHAERVTKVFQAAGLPARLVHSNQKNADQVRKEAVEWLNSTPGAILVNVDILTTGFDCPSLQSVIIARATKSLTLWVQMVGRASRICKKTGKSTFKYIDLGGNADRLMLWEAERDWKALFNNPKLASEEGGIPPTKECPECGLLNPAGVTRCQECDYVFEPNEKHGITGKAVKIGYQNLPKRLKKSFSELSVEELIERAKYGSIKLGRPYKNGWIISQLKQREEPEKELKKYAKIKGYNQKWVKHQL